MTSRSSQYFVQNHNALVAQYIVPPAALTFAPASYVVANPPLVASPLVARAAVAPFLANPVVAPTPGAVATQPAGQQPVPSPNPDAETVEVESARVRSVTPVQKITQQPIRAAQQQPVRPLNLRLLPVPQPQQRNAKVQAAGQRTAAPGVVNGQRFLFA